MTGRLLAWALPGLVGRYVAASVVRPPLPFALCNVSGRYRLPSDGAYYTTAPRYLDMYSQYSTRYSTSTNLDLFGGHSAILPFCTVHYTTLHYTTMVYTTIRPPLCYTWYNMYSTIVQYESTVQFLPWPTLDPIGRWVAEGSAQKGKKGCVPGSGLLLSTAHRYGNAML